MDDDVVYIDSSFAAFGIKLIEIFVYQWKIFCLKQLSFPILFLNLVNLDSNKANILNMSFFYLLRMRIEHCKKMKFSIKNFFSNCEENSGYGLIY